MNTLFRNRNPRATRVAILHAVNHGEAEVEITTGPPQLLRQTEEGWWYFAADRRCRGPYWTDAVRFNQQYIPVPEEGAE